MKFFSIVFTILGIVFIMNLTDILVQYSLKDRIYICEEVTKADPIDVQKICNKRWRRK